mgnify:CR=1 FL=1
MAAVEHSLRDTNLVQICVVDVNEHQNNLVTRRFGGGYKVKFANVGEYGFKAKAVTLAEFIESEFFGNACGFMTIIYGVVWEGFFGNDICCWLQCWCWCIWVMLFIISRWW